MIAKTIGRPTKSKPRVVNTMTELAAFCGVAVKTIQHWKETEGFPVEEDGSWSPFKVGQWHAIRNAIPTAPAGDEDTGDEANNPWLEEYRKEKTLLARMDRRERERGLLDRERTHSFMLRVASLLRGVTDKLQRMFGESAYEILNDAIDDMEAETEREFADDPEFDTTEAIESVRG
jgi:phage terminase Nu1 subunit (DNA packaging protein)